MDATASPAVHTDVDIALGPLQLQGSVGLPAQTAQTAQTTHTPPPNGVQPNGVVVFAHGSGSGRLSPRNQFVAGVLEQAGFATLLFDLLTAEEEYRERYTRHLRFDIGLLANRLIGATQWLRTQPTLAALPIGYFGASTGAAAALVATAQLAGSSWRIAAVVSRGGRPDLAGAALARVQAPTLLIVGRDDTQVIALNQHALQQLAGVKALELVPHATHLFEEPGTLARAAHLAADWFGRYLRVGVGA